MDAQNIGSSFLSQTGVIEANPLKSNKITCLYFSASWCPPCQAFTPLLVDFYNEINMDEKQLEIIFVTSDKKDDEFKNYYSQMPWLAIPFGDTRIEELTNKHGVKGIPVLIVLKPNGEALLKNGKQDVMTEGEEAFNKWVGLLENKQD